MLNVTLKVNREVVFKGKFAVPAVSKEVSQ